MNPVFVLTILLHIFFVANAEARVAKLKDQTLATYIHGTFGLSLIGKSPYERADVTFTNQVAYNASGEIGALFTLSRTNFKLGLEVIRPQLIQGAQAQGAGEVTLYRVTSGIVSYGPTLGFDFLLGSYDNFRFYITSSIGYMKTTLKNDYAFTDEGRTQYSLIDHTEEGSAYNVMSRGGLGMEFSFSDNTSLAMDLGYRSLVATGLVHERPAATFNGTVSAGDVMKDPNGNNRKVDLSGAWIGMGLRFYFP
ncbi:MAG: hypothetical protein AB7F59_00575 [Bdellovibrionales bacterium]